MSQLISQGGRTITKTPMVDRINDIVWQARQGSVAAIIQLMNERLAKFGVRTRAIFSDGVLQLLCEAARVEQLEQSTLVEQIQQILESIAPRNIRRVNINSRIVREQQLLWLKEIYRDRDNQLLWSQEITLAQPHIIKQLIKDFTEAQTELGKQNLPKTQSSRTLVLTNKNKLTKKPKKSMLAVAGLCLLLLLGWVVYAQLGSQLKSLMQRGTSKSLTTANTHKNKSQVSLPTTNKSLATLSNDPFAASVRLANRAFASGKTATNSTQWLELAVRWQQASDLMSTVPPNHSRYQEAQIRTKLYRKYSEAAQKEAEKSRS